MLSMEKLKNLKWKLTRPFKHFYYFCIKLYIYAKLLWSDYEWDYVYLLRVMQLKMRLMSEHMEKDGITVSSTRKAKELKLCVDLIQRIVDNEYGSIALDNISKKYGKIKMDENPIEINGHKYYELNIYHENAPKGTDAYEQESKETRKAFEDAERQRKQDIAYHFDTMKKRLEGWWD